tara:strand:+ start:14 stop:1825 length:1812 start_codon:yes stop_codon:yes gene_type:complete
MADKKIRLLVKAEVDKAIKDFRKLDGQVKKTSDSKDRMRVNTEGLERGLGQLRNKILLVTFAFAGIGTAIANTVRTSARFEALETRLVALKGSVEEGRKAFEFFNNVAKTTPFQLENVVEAGAQLEAFGADSTETLKAVSDLAAFMGTDIVDAANAFGRAFAGGAGAADVLRERGVLTQVKLKTGFEDLSKLTLPEFREALVNTLTDPDGNIAGATDLLSQTFSGLVSNFQDSLSQLSDSIGDLLAPSIKSIIKTLKDGVDDITEAFKRLNETQLETTIRQLKEAGLETGNLEILNKEILLAKKQEITAGNTLESLREKNKQNEEDRKRINQEILDLQKEALSVGEDEVEIIKVVSGRGDRILEQEVSKKSLIENQINDKIRQLALEAQSITDNNELIRLLKEQESLEETIRLLKEGKLVVDEESKKNTDGILNVDQELAKSAQKQLALQIKQGQISADNAINLIKNLFIELATLRLKNRLQSQINAKKEKELQLTQQTAAASAISGGFLGFVRGLFQTGGSYINRFQGGGSFNVNRRTILPTNPPAIVGDNASGMERIDVTPLPSPTSSGNNITINISAPLVDETVVDTIIPAIRRAEKLNL